jgi:hypothetical protein
MTLHCITFHDITLKEMQLIWGRLQLIWVDGAASETLAQLKINSALCTER